MSKDAGSEKTIEEMRVSKRHLQQKVEDLEKKLHAVMD